MAEQSETGAVQAAEPILGSWLLRVSGGKDPAERELISFLPGGVVLATNTPIDVSSLQPGTYTGYFTPGHGAWAKTGDGQYRSTAVFVTVNTDGTFQGTTTVTLRLTLSPDGASVRGPYSAILRNNTDEVVYTTPDEAGSIEGTRITA